MKIRTKVKAGLYLLGSNGGNGGGNGQGECGGPGQNVQGPCPPPQMGNGGGTTNKLF